MSPRLGEVPWFLLPFGSWGESWSKKTPRGTQVQLLQQTRGEGLT